jgi:hypothetical protein
VANSNEINVLNMGPERLVRFWAKVNKTGEGGCWLWTASVNSRGYGSFSIGINANASVHKVSWAMAKNNGVMSDPKSHVMHSCDVRRCVNPEHLSLGSARDNAQDAIRKGRATRVIPSSRETCKRGHLRTEENTNPKYNTCIPCKQASDRESKTRERKRDPEKYNKYHREQYHKTKSGSNKVFENLDDNHN